LFQKIIKFRRYHEIKQKTHTEREGTEVNQTNENCLKFLPVADNNLSYENKKKGIFKTRKTNKIKNKGAIIFFLEKSDLENHILKHKKI